MDIKSLAAEIAKFGLPLLGAALPIPGGAAIGAALATAIGADSAKPEDILAALSSNADAVAKAREFEATHRETILRITIDAEIRAIVAVNATMQAEAASDHWPTYSWRPAIGFSFAANLVVSSFLVVGVFGAQIFAAPGADKAIAALPMVLGALAALNGLATPVLGIASYYRGKMQANPALPTDNRG